MPHCHPYVAACLGLAAMALATISGPGCGPSAHARLWADTAMADGSFSLQRRQWAYDGELITFELECDPGLADFVVFGISGEEAVVDTAKVEGRYRWAHVFRCGPRPQTYEVYALPYLMRGKCDWVYDKNEDKWYHYPGRTEKPDLPTDREQRLEITCYRVEVKVRFAAQAGPPKGIELALIKDSGERTVIPQRGTVDSAAPGFLLLGPDAAGLCEVAYVPRYGEVGRNGKTRAELTVEHADGSVERLRQDLDTP